MCDSGICRCDATTIRIRPYIGTDELVMEDRKTLGLKVFTPNPYLGGIFGVNLEDDYEVVQKAMLEAIRVGDHVFYIEYGDHSAKWFRIRQNRPKRDWDSGCAGVIIANHDGWHRTFPQETFAKTHVFKRFSSLFDEYVTAILNGWLWEAEVLDEEEEAFYGPFLSQEEAMEAMAKEYPGAEIDLEE